MILVMPRRNRSAITGLAAFSSASYFHPPLLRASPTAERRRLRSGWPALSRLFASTFLAALLGCSILGSAAHAQSSVTLAWDPSSADDVAGYNLYYGVASRTYTNEISVGDATSVTVTGLVAGTTYFFAVTAYDSAGLESAYSDEISYTVPLSNPDPAVALISPADDATFIAPAAINLVADVVPNAHAIIEVDFYNGGALLAQVATAPYSFTWTNVGAGTFSLTARLIFDSGSTADSTVATIHIVAPSPTLQPGMTADGQFALSVAGQPGLAYDVLASQDLTTWTVIGAVTLDASGSAQFVDSASPGIPNRVYRLRSSPQLSTSGPTLQRL